MFITHRCLMGNHAICPGYSQDKQKFCYCTVCNHKKKTEFVYPSNAFAGFDTSIDVETYRDAKKYIHGLNYGVGFNTFARNIYRDNPLLNYLKGREVTGHLYSTEPNIEKEPMNFIFSFCAKDNCGLCTGSSKDHKCTHYCHEIKELKERLASLEKKTVKKRRIEFSTPSPKIEYSPEMIWKSSNGRKTPIPEMATSHLVNTLNWIHDSVGSMRNQLTREYRDFNTIENDNDTGLQVVEKRLRKYGNRIALKTVANSNTPLLAHEIFPQYPNLVTEAMKRKIEKNERGEYVNP